MKLPNVERAVIPEGKIVNYELSLTHAVGRGKAKFFMRYGFSLEHWQVLAEALMNHARIHEVTKVEQTPFGERYVVEGTLETPIGRTPFVRVVWFIDTGEDIPRFVTAYPQEEEGTSDD